MTSGLGSSTLVKVTLVNLIVLDEAWGLSEEAKFGRRMAETEADVHFLTLEEYEEE